MICFEILKCGKFGNKDYNINNTWNILLVKVEFSGQSNLFHVTIYSTLFQTLNELVLAQLS